LKIGPKHTEFVWRYIENGGNVKEAALTIGVDPTTPTRWFSDDEFKIELKRIEDIVYAKLKGKLQDDKVARQERILDLQDESLNKLIGLMRAPNTKGETVVKIAERFLTEGATFKGSEHSGAKFTVNIDLEKANLLIATGKEVDESKRLPESVDVETEGEIVEETRH